MMLPLKTVVVICLVCAMAGAVGLYLLASAVSAWKKRKKRKARSAAAEKGQPEKKRLLGRIGTMNLILFICAVAIVAFTLEMIDLFKEYGMIPDTLVSCVFLAVTGECGFMGWIKTNKEKYRDRRWQKRDRLEAAAETPPPSDPPAAG